MVKAYAYDKFTVEIGSDYIAGAENVQVPVKLYNLTNNGISAMSFVIEFDSALTLNGVSAGDIISKSSDFSYSVRENKIYILFSDSSAGSNPIKTGGAFCYLNFKTNKYKGTYYINRLSSNREAFVDNWMSKIEPDFKSGSLTYKNRY